MLKNNDRKLRWINVAKKIENFKVLAISFTEVTLNMYILIILLITEKGMWVYKRHVSLSRRYIVERLINIECICVEGPVGCEMIRVGSARLVLGALPNANSRRKWFCILVALGHNTIV